MDETPRPLSEQSLTGLTRGDLVLLWITLPMWLLLSLSGTLIDSTPFRTKFTAFEGGVGGTLWNGLLVLGTYTMPNIALLCMFASVLGAIGAKAQLGADTGRPEKSAKDLTSPRSSAVLRGFLVYLTLIAGVLLLGQTPTAPTQTEYVKLAGVMSVVSFLVSYHPTAFGQLLERSGRLISGGDAATKSKGTTG